MTLRELVVDTDKKINKSVVVFVWWNGAYCPVQNSIRMKVFLMLILMIRTQETTTAEIFMKVGVKSSRLSNLSVQSILQTNPAAPWEHNLQVSEK